MLDSEHTPKMSSYDDSNDDNDDKDNVGQVLNLSKVSICLTKIQQPASTDNQKTTRYRARCKTIRTLRLLVVSSFISAESEPSLS